MTEPTPPAPSSLFVGNLDPRVYRELLEEIFSLAAPVIQCHIVYDKTTGSSSGFGFVDYIDHETAQNAMEKFRGRTIYGKTLTIDWARAATLGTQKAEEVAPYCLFVGNLSPDVTDDQLLTAFRQFGSCVSAKCTKDVVTNKTQGFAFVSFQQRTHALVAMEAMNGQILNNRALRVEWAKGKTGTRMSEDVEEREEKTGLSFEAIVAQTAHNNITAYVAGLSVNTSEEKIRDRFSRYGEIREIRIPESVRAQATETVYAFVRYHDHESAARAIYECQNGAEVDGKQVQVHWGRESVRRGQGGFHGGFQGGGYGGYAQQGYGGRGGFSQGGYGRGGPGPMYQQAYAGGQNRYRPY